MKPFDTVLIAKRGHPCDGHVAEVYSSLPVGPATGVRRWKVRCEDTGRHPVKFHDLSERWLNPRISPTLSRPVPTEPIFAIGEPVLIARGLNHEGHTGTIAAFEPAPGGEGTLAVVETTKHCGCTEGCFWGGPARGGTSSSDPRRMVSTVRFRTEHLDSLLTKRLPSPSSPRLLMVAIPLTDDPSEDPTSVTELIDFIAEHHAEVTFVPTQS